MRVCGRLCETGEVVTLSLAENRIARISVGEEAADIGGADVWVAPGFLDLQVNGYGGHDFNRRAWGGPGEVSADFAPVFELAARAGTALLCPTITTNSHEAMIAALAALALALEED